MKTRAMFGVVLTLLVACGPSPEPVAVHARAAQSFDTLDQLLAPVALYPDQLLAQILMSAGDPAKVGELNRWLKANQQLKGTQLQDAALKAGFEPSFVALVLFPQVVAHMADQIDWTTLLGQAFAADRTAVFAAIQRLRHQAQDVGTLKSTPQQEIASKTTATGEDVIVIEPANPQVVYVPQYNPQVVYTQAPAPAAAVSGADAAAAGIIGFTAGIAIGAAMNNNYYYGPYGWHGGAYMYNDAWDDYADRREDAREDWQDHREDIATSAATAPAIAPCRRRSRRCRTRANQTNRQATGEKRAAAPDACRDRRSACRCGASTASTAKTQGAGRTGSAEARGYGDGSKAQAAKSGGSDAFSGYSSGKAERSSSARGQRSRSSSRGGGGRRR
jgi:hypothetical protein